MIKVIPW